MGVLLHSTIDFSLITREGPKSVSVLQQTPRLAGACGGIYILPPTFTVDFHRGRCFGNQVLGFSRVWLTMADMPMFIARKGDYKGPPLDWIQMKHNVDSYTPWPFGTLTVDSGGVKCNGRPLTVDELSRWAALLAGTLRMAILCPITPDKLSGTIDDS